jgi:hypothetical protein
VIPSVPNKTIRAAVDRSDYYLGPKPSFLTYCCGELISDKRREDRLMHRPKFFCLLIFLTAVLESSAVCAQDFQARAVAHYRRGTMFMLDRMADPKTISGCSRLVMAGTVAAVEYDNQNQIVNFSLILRNDRTRRVSLPKLLYERQLPSEAEVGLSRLVDRGKRIRVVAYGCEGSAGELEADQIRAR